MHAVALQKIKKIQITISNITVSEFMFCDLRDKIFWTAFWQHFL